MSRVLLAHSNHVFSDSKQTAKMQPYPALLTILAGACLRERGIETRLFDPALEEAPWSAFERSLAAFRPEMLAVCEDDFNFLSKMCLAHNRAFAFQMGAAARSSGIVAAAHGADAADHAEEYLRAGFDVVITGEVEEALLEIAAGNDFAGIAGIAYGNRGLVTRTAPRKPRRNLDELPLPAWDLVDIDRYRGAWNSAHGYFALNLAASRGCPFRCNWCAKPVYGDSFQTRSAASVAAEMLYLKRCFRPDRIWFADDIFALSGRWTLEFAEEVEARDARIPFRMQSRCDLMTRATVEALRRAGCQEVWMGAESGSQAVLDAMDKGIQVRHVYEARENLRRNGIRACFFLQFGYPGETWEDIEKTVRMVRETGPDDIGISVSYPLPGTRFHERVGAQIGAKANWADSADLAMIFRGTYSTEFYRVLADALHAEVRGGDAGAAWRRVREIRAGEPRAPLLAGVA
ncbi:MAG: radical SAM protein [Acidobacteriota bacterium]|nr:radical SAM protein [Acidobacteriota bacterium]